MSALQSRRRGDRDLRSAKPRSIPPKAIVSDLLQTLSDERTLRIIGVEEQILSLWRKLMLKNGSSADVRLQITRLGQSSRIAASNRARRASRPTPLCVIRETSADRYQIAIAGSAAFECGPRLSPARKASIQRCLVKVAEKLTATSQSRQIRRGAR